MNNIGKFIHTLTLYRDNDRMGGSYGKFYWVECSGSTIVDRFDIDSRDGDYAWELAYDRAKRVGAKLVNLSGQ